MEVREEDNSMSLFKYLCKILKEPLLFLSFTEAIQELVELSNKVAITEPVAQI